MSINCGISVSNSVSDIIRKSAFDANTIFNTKYELTQCVLD